VLSCQFRLKTLPADEAGKVVLEAHIPEVLAESAIAMALNMPLAWWLGWPGERPGIKSPAYRAALRERGLAG
jgi:hypothetical protein